MRIAIITENFLPKVDGVTRTLTRLLEHLQATGHKVILFGPESGMDVYAGAKLYGTAGFPFFPYPELKLNIWRPAFTKILLDFDPHVVHLVDPVYICAAFLAIFRFKNKKPPIVASYHTNLGTYCTQFGWGLFASLMWSWNRYCHSQCDYTVCPSESTRHILHTKRFKNLRIWPRGIDTALFSPQQRSDELRAQWLTTGDVAAEVNAAAIIENKIVILYVGRVSYEKNLGLVLESYKKMDHTKCHLVIVGHGPAFHHIQEDCSISQTPVTFAGYLQGIDLATSYASADIFAFPSFTETFGQVVLESMASGLPVVGLLAEGVKDLVQDKKSGFLLDTTGMSRPKQIKEYGILLTKLIEDLKLRKDMGQKGIELSNSYTWWGAMESVMQVYQDAVAKHHINISDDGENTAIDSETINAEEDIELSSIVIEDGQTLSNNSSDSGMEDDFTDISSIESGLIAPNNQKREQQISHLEESITNSPTVNL